MQYLKTFSGSLRLSLLVIIASLFYAPHGWAMDIDDGDTPPSHESSTNEEESEESPASNEPNNGKNNKRKHDQVENSEVPQAKHPRTNEGEVLTDQGSAGFYDDLLFNALPYDQETWDFIGEEPAQSSSSSSSSSSSALTMQEFSQNIPTDQQDNASKILQFGDQYFTKKDFTMARTFYEKAAALGLPEAHYKAAEACYKQYMEQLDNQADESDIIHYVHAALDHFEQAAAKNYVLSLEDSTILENGLNEYILNSSGEQLDFKRIVRLCRLTEKNPQILSWLSQLYLSGKGVPQSEDQALEYFTKALELDKTLDRATLFYLIGSSFWTNKIHADYKWFFFPEEDIPQAINYFKKSAGLGNIDASRALATLFLEGKVSRSDFKKVLPSLKEGSDRGDGRCSYTLGCVYETHPSIFYDPETAQKYYKRGVKLYNQDCLNKFLSDHDLIKSFKISLCLLNNRPKKAIRIRANEYRAKGLELIKFYTVYADELESKALYNLGKMLSYKIFREYTPAFMRHLDIGADETFKQEYTLAKKSFSLAATSQENGVPVGKARFKLAKLINLEGNPVDLDQGIEAATLAIEEHGIEKALPICASLYQHKRNDQMAAAYFFESVCKGFSTRTNLSPYFTFVKSASLGTEAMADPLEFDKFEKKINALLLGCRSKYLLHTSAFALDTEGSKSVADLGPLYKTLKKYWKDLMQCRIDLMDAELSSSAGLMVSNVKLTGSMRKKYSSTGDDALKGFYIVTLDDQELLCLGGKKPENNPKKGIRLQNLITTQGEEALQALDKMGTIYQRELDHLGLSAEDEKARLQFTEEQSCLPLIRKAIQEEQVELRNIGVTRASRRAKAFEESHGELFKD